MKYKAPLKDIKFVSNEILDMPGHFSKFTRGQAVDQDTLEAIYTEAANFCEKS